MLRKAVIIAGGFGTRIAEKFPDIPKSLTPISGKPILQWQIETLTKQGINEIYVILGYKANAIQNFLDRKQNFGIKIVRLVEDTPLGTGGGLYYLKDRIKEDFILCLGDILFNIDLHRLYKFHKKHHSTATLVVHPNSHPYDSDLVVMDNVDRIIKWISKNSIKPALYNNLVSSGVYVFSPSIFEEFHSLKKRDLDKDIISSMIEVMKPVYGYKTPEYLKDIGTINRILEAEQDVRKGIVNKKNLKNRQKALFLDRDGTINKYKGFISNHKDIELESHVGEAIKIANKSSYLVIVITNQPVIARNLCDFDELHKIHQQIEVLLGRYGAYLDAIYFCPHHPDKGYPEEQKEFKVDCECRKPKIGLIEKAVRDYNIDLAKSWIIGDSTVDIETGRRAGIKTILLNTGVSGSDKKYDVHPHFKCENLLSAIRFIIEKGE